MQVQRICAVAFASLAFGCVAELGDPHEEETTELAAAPMDRIAHCASHAAEETQSLAMINGERVNAGLPALERVWDLEDDARLWSRSMHAAGFLSHNPNLASVTTGWSALGENVGVGGSVASLHGAFMNSPGHRANILSDSYSYIGIGAYRDDTGVLWVTHVFMGAGPGRGGGYAPFTDDEHTTHERNIHAFYCAGITNGCGGDQFCPTSSVTREQMAAFLVRAFELPAATGSDVDHFIDDDGSIFENAIDALAASGITVGCSSDGTEFCPKAEVTRGQMAVFLSRGLALPAPTGDYFDDDTGLFYENAANQMKEAGITVGCGPTSYCGEDPVTRAQMATFVARALGL